jgi:hypothetical protein
MKISVSRSQNKLWDIYTTYVQAECKYAAIIV